MNDDGIDLRFRRGPRLPDPTLIEEVLEQEHGVPNFGSAELNLLLHEDILAGGHATRDDILAAYLRDRGYQVLTPGEKPRVVISLEDSTIEIFNVLADRPVEVCVLNSKVEVDDPSVVRDDNGQPFVYIERHFDDQVNIEPEEVARVAGWSATSSTNWQHYQDADDQYSDLAPGATTVY